LFTQALSHRSRAQSIQRQCPQPPGRRLEIGAAWPKQSSEGRDCLSRKLDDPSFTAPIFANLFDDPDGESYTLIWSRSRKKNGE
jgi:uncharacterized protein (DUF736 family)